jgi:hypothetical protein
MMECIERTKLAEWSGGGELKVGSSGNFGILGIS